MFGPGNDLYVGHFIRTWYEKNLVAIDFHLINR